MSRLTFVATLLLACFYGPSAHAGDIHPAAHVVAPTLALQWRTRLTKLPIMAWKPRAKASPRLTLDGAGVIFAGPHGVAVLRVNDGGLAWRFQTGDAVEGHTAERDGVIYAATADGQVLALDRHTGRKVWPPAQLRAAVHAGVVIDARHIYIVADPGTVHAVSRATGKVVWRRTASTSRDFLVEGHGAAMVRGNLVFAGTAGGRLLALSTRDGAIAWQARLAVQSTVYTDVDATPTPLGKHLIVASAHNTGVFALNAADGRLAWQVRLAGARQPWVHDGLVYVIAGDGDLHVLDAKGRQRWARNIATRPSGAIGFIDQLLLVPTEGGLLLAQQRDGVAIARFADGYGFAGAPLVVGNRVFVLSNAGIAYGLALVR